MIPTTTIQNRVREKRDKREKADAGERSSALPILRVGDNPLQGRAGAYFHGLRVLRPNGSAPSGHAAAPVAARRRQLSVCPFRMALNARCGFWRALIPASTTFEQVTGICSAAE
jgi:hypothetical protein